jgi:hypothetical protein
MDADKEGFLRSDRSLIQVQRPRERAHARMSPGRGRRESEDDGRGVPTERRSTPWEWVGVKAAEGRWKSGRGGFTGQG